ncbi:sortase [Candidatus Roseilinea sp. NK_OTU-006]|jgi:sortase A|uniref:sortase n=1 Tax=Candidatus Roseilinea sp. NK_OTU-006 TaxID=2704250 RepID=UPI00145DA935|nr:sortase [Candidatus Roseilinea sp. NK_OTU-006]
MLRPNVRRGIAWSASVALIALGAAIFAGVADMPAAASRRVLPAQGSQVSQEFAGLSSAAAIYPVPERIWIDKLKVNARIQPVGPGKRVGVGVVEWTAPNNQNVGWHDYSGRLGEGKNIVLNGHNNIYGSVFRKLYTLQPGDEIRLGAGDRQVIYRVREVKILRERDQPLAVRIANAQYIQPMNDDRLTLVSCWPEWSNTHRVIVIAHPVAED